MSKRPGLSKALSKAGNLFVAASTTTPVHRTGITLVNGCVPQELAVLQNHTYHAAEKYFHTKRSDCGVIMCSLQPYIKNCATSGHRITWQPGRQVSSINSFTLRRLHPVHLDQQRREQARG